MQQLAHLYIDGQKVLVLVRRKQYGVALKLRASGVDGQRLTDEETYIRLHAPENGRRLLAGEVVHQ